MTRRRSISHFSIPFRNSLDSNLICQLCKNLLTRPKQSSCGHRFCEDCLETLINLSSEQPPQCPRDGTELSHEQIFPDRFCERDIQNLECFCFNRKQGCGWTGELRNFKDHGNKCEYSIVNCPNAGCKETIENRYVDNHVQNTCDHRLVMCENCNAQVIYIQLELHLSLCPKVNEQCIMGCGAMVSRGDLEEHVSEQCSNASVPCRFSHAGCEFIGPRSEMEKHEANSVEKHTNILGAKTNESVDSFKKMEEKINSLESEKDHLKTQVHDTREALAFVKQDFQTQQIKINIVEKNMSELKKDSAVLKESLQNLQSNAENDDAIESQVAEIVSLVQSQEKRLIVLDKELSQERTAGHGQDTRSLGYAASSTSNENRRIDRNERISAVNDVKLSEHDIRIQMLEATSYDGVYIWKIDEWARRVSEARIGKTTSIYSPPFYVGRYGYKICGRLYPCGDGIGKGTHVSLFFVVMRGEYDALLSWPFRQKVMFKLLHPNRLNDINDSFRPDPNSSSFQKPRSAMNIASGTPQFVTQRAVNDGGYVNDDTVFVKISVDKSGLREI